MRSVDRLAASLRPSPAARRPRRSSWVGTVSSVDAVNHTVTLNSGQTIKYVETPTALSTNDKVLVQRLSIGTLLVTARLP